MVHQVGAIADMWEYAADYLVNRGFRVIAYDQRGFGRSDKPFTGYDLTTLANDLRAVLVAKGVADVTLVGHSLGAAVARRYMGIYGDDLVGKLIIASGPGPTPPRMPQPILDAIIAGVRNDKPRTLATGIDSFLLWSPLHFPSEEFRRWIKDQAINQVPLWVLISLLQDVNTDNLAPDDASITVCTLVIHGLLDAFIPVDQGIQTSQTIPGAELVIYETSGHNTWYEEKDRFHLDIEQWAIDCTLRPGTTPGLPPELPPTVPTLTDFGPLGPVIEQLPLPPLPLP